MHLLARTSVTPQWDGVDLQMSDGTAGAKVYIRRIHGNEIAWVRGGYPFVLDASGVGHLFDFEPPYAHRDFSTDAVYYEVFDSYKEDTRKLLATSDRVRLLREDGKASLRNVFYPQTRRKTLIVTDFNPSYPSRAVRHEVIGRQEPFTISDVRTSMGGTITFYCTSADEEASLVALADEGQPLLLRCQPPSAVPDFYFTAGGVEVDLLGVKGHRLVTVEFAEVKPRPVLRAYIDWTHPPTDLDGPPIPGDSTGGGGGGPAPAGFRYSDMMAFATYQTIVEQRATYAALEQDPTP